MNKIDRLALIKSRFAAKNDVIGVLPVSPVEIQKEIAKVSRGSTDCAFAHDNRTNDGDTESAEGIVSSLSFDRPNPVTERETEILLSETEKRHIVREIGRKIVSTVFRGVSQSNPVEIMGENESIFPSENFEDFIPAIDPEMDRFARARAAFEMDCENRPLALMA